MPFDVTDTQQIRETRQKALAKFAVDVLFNNTSAILTTTSLAAIIGLPSDGACRTVKRAQRGMV